jgi:hypothetical protein
VKGGNCLDFGFWVHGRSRSMELRMVKRTGERGGKPKAGSENCS